MKRFLVMFICLAALKIQASEQSHEINITIKIQCPSSEEFDRFLKSTPPGGDYVSDFDVWRASFSKNMAQLVELVESGKISEAHWSVKTE